jgi:predicted metalloprotease with PDZ domain
MIYTIKPLENGFLNIELEFIPSRTGTWEILLPTWRPGRYQSQHFAKNIPSLHAFSGANNCTIQKIASSAWQLTLADLSPVRISYTYLAQQADAGGSVVADDLLYINFINCLVFPKGWENKACELNIQYPDTWQIATSLREKGGKYTAKNYRELVDSPFLAAPSVFSHAWKEGKTKFYLEGIGPTTHFSKKLIQAYKQIAAFQIQWMGDFPVKNYHFLLWICPKPYYHGVEHTQSTMMVMGPPERDCFEDLIGLGSHELFHVWNVATIRPKPLLPYVYTKEVYFDTAWVVEGITTYLGDWFLGASGVISWEEYVACLLGNLKLHFERDGRSQQSLVESSIDIWLDGYGSALPGKRVSIYYKGALVALAIDLMLRQKFSHAKSMRDVMQLMQARYGYLKKGYTLHDFYALVQEVYEGSLADFWHKRVESAHPLEDDIAELLRFVGLHFYQDQEGQFHLDPLPAAEEMRHIFLR